MLSSLNRVELNDVTKWDPGRKVLRRGDATPILLIVQTYVACPSTQNIADVESGLFRASNRTIRYLDSRYYILANMDAPRPIYSAFSSGRGYK